MRTSFKSFWVLAVALSFCGFGSLNEAQACTAFKLNGKKHFIVAKDYIWFAPQKFGKLFVNAKGAEKIALDLDGLKNPARWTAQYGSLTFTQFGKELPIGGMNEAGLVIEALQLDRSSYPEQASATPMVNEAQWIQYNLDRYATVEEVIAHMNELRVRKAFTGLHYFVCDATSLCASIEYQDGKIAVHRSTEEGPAVITNHFYTELYEDWRLSDGSYGFAPFGRSSKPRFGFTAKLVKEAETRAATSESSHLIDNAFDILDEIKVTAVMTSIWQVVYSPEIKTLWFRTASNERISKVSMSDFKFSCADGRKVMDMNSREWSTHTLEANEELLSKSRLLVGAKKAHEAALYPFFQTRCYDN